MNVYEMAVWGAIDYYKRQGEAPNRVRAHPLMVRQLKHDVAPELIGFNVQDLRSFSIVCAVGELAVEQDISIPIGCLCVDRLA